MGLQAHYNRLASALVAEILQQQEQAVDGILRRTFRQHKQMGSRDRRRVSDRVYLTLRHLRRLHHQITGATELPAEPLDQAALLPLTTLAADWLAEGLPPRGEEEPDPCFYSLPDWLWHRWHEQFGPAQSEQLALAMLEPGFLELRVNTMKAKRQQVARQLSQEGLENSPLKGNSCGLRLTERRTLRDHPLFQQGRVEIQDGGSQQIAPLVNAKPGEKIVDFCAGGGGKTLHLAALMQNRGELLALDNQAHRLERLKPRLKRAGVRVVQSHTIAHEQDPWLTRWHEKADAVLVDAPCSGLGTLRRHPEIKWRLAEAAIPSLNQQQQSLLNAAAKLVRPGGRLVYATCSLLAAENSQVIEAFLAQHDSFALQPGADALSGEGEPSQLQLLPHQTGSDGFYAVALIRS
uniref:Putative nucleolar protein, Sun (Fmu) family protein or tRNA/rRNA cytosine-C5-methylase n=1 Tax=Magnetococcus massalia (strain MO-1) TaxID=451514 RepID=A0A1S7LM02_MAGMO|nr:Putative nucleolar protein, Sun (Fmu) family protein or tRNA/rRNA cytosine-C5-methylase [Candidatus Magnetococcus massalia]